MQKVWEVTRLLFLIALVTAILCLSYWLTCGYELATACFAGIAVVAAILAYRSQEAQRRSGVLDTKRAQLWASFDSMMALAENRRPTKEVVDGARTALRAIEYNDASAYRKATHLLLDSYPAVSDYWMVVGVWCNLLFSQHAAGLDKDVEAISTLLVGALGTTHVDCLVEYACTSYQSAFYPVIVAMWKHGGVRDKLLSDYTPRIQKADENIEIYIKARLSTTTK